MANKLVDSAGLKKFAECFYDLMGTKYNPYTTNISYTDLEFNVDEIVVDKTSEVTEETPSE